MVSRVNAKNISYWGDVVVLDDQLPWTQDYQKKNSFIDEKFSCEFQIELLEKWRVHTQLSRMNVNAFDDLEMLQCN